MAREDGRVVNSHSLQFKKGEALKGKTRIFSVKWKDCGDKL